MSMHTSLAPVPSLSPQVQFARLVRLALMLPLAAQASDGLVAPAADTLWPQWQARIAVQAAAAPPLTMASLLDSSSGNRALQGASLLGDYVFASPSFGNFRATGGLFFGNAGGAPLLSAAAGPRLGLALQAGAATAPGQDTVGTLPYLGLGFRSAALLPSLSVSADIGWVAGQSSALAGGGRPLFGNQASPGLRELRVSPVLQLGLRYAF
jgi:hypothetical protein